MSQAATLGGRLDECLKELRLPTVRACYPELVDQATQESLGYERFLFELMDHEREGRRQRRVERFLRDSRLPLEKSLEAFDMKRLPTKLRQQVTSLLEGSFVDRRGRGPSSWPSSRPSLATPTSTCVRCPTASKCSCGSKG